MTEKEYMAIAHRQARYALRKNQNDYDYIYYKHIAECMALHCIWLLGDGLDSDGRVIKEQWLDQQWSELCSLDKPVAPGGAS
jgi:hypothetical protein